MDLKILTGISAKSVISEDYSTSETHTTIRLHKETIELRQIAEGGTEDERVSNEEKRRKKIISPPRV